MDKWDCIGGVYGKLSGSGSNKICLVLPLQSLVVLIVLVVREHASKDRVEFGETCDEWAGELLRVSHDRCSYNSRRNYLSQPVEQHPVSQDAYCQSAEVDGYCCCCNPDHCTY